VLPCFRHSIIDVGEERRSASPPPAGVTRTITHVQAGVRTRVQVDEAFLRGAVAVIGWPTEDELPAGNGGRGVPPDLQVVMELINRVDRQEPIDRLESVLTRDPSLAFRLLRYLNSAAFGLTVEIASFRHALMLLGHQKLKRWLALLLAQSTQDPAARPAMFAAVRRGVLMEELVRPSGDATMAGEVFICGVFSLLDRMLQQPFSELLKSVPVPERVRQALAEGSGPYQPYLELVGALEQASRSDIREAADRAFLGLAEVNAALLRSLAVARELD
jgi:EAL and modified HD-GYP domain-containing signal transduction protein